MELRCNADRILVVDKITMICLRCGHLSQFFAFCSAVMWIQLCTERHPLRRGIGGIRKRQITLDVV